MADYSTVRVGKWFRLSEFAPRGGEPLPAGSPLHIRSLVRNALDPLRERFGPVTVISGCRTTARNAAVGGAPLSHHLYARHLTSPAADVACAQGTPRDWYAFLDGLRVGGLGLYPGHVHVDLRTTRARW